MFGDVVDWYRGNKLVLNKNKSNVMLCRIKQAPEEVILLQVQIVIVEITIFFGPHMNEYLNYNYHINRVCM